jgi:hypothetical protein
MAKIEGERRPDEEIENLFDAPDPSPVGMW